MECPNCSNNQFKEITIRYKITTRDNNRKHLYIENLPVDECIVCGKIVPTEKSEYIIGVVKNMVTEELKRKVEIEKSHKDVQNHSVKESSSLKGVLKQLIG